MVSRGENSAPPVTEQGRQTASYVCRGLLLLSLLLCRELLQAKLTLIGIKPCLLSIYKPEPGSAGGLLVGRGNKVQGCQECA